MRTDIPQLPCCLRGSFSTVSCSQGTHLNIGFHLKLSFMAQVAGPTPGQGSAWQFSRPWEPLLQ